MSSLSSSGRPYRRVQAQVYAEESHCWLCGRHVDQQLPHNDPMARSIDHVIPKVRGGTDHRTNLRLAHRQCNSDRGAGNATPNNPRTVTW